MLARPRDALQKEIPLHHKLLSHFPNIPIESYERLTVYQFKKESRQKSEEDAVAMFQSVSAFQSLLEGLGVESDKLIIADFLKKDLATRTRAPNSDKIFNKAQAKIAMEQTANRWMWQE